MAVATQGPPMRLRCRMQYGPSKTRLLQTLENHAAIAMVRQDIARVGIPLPKTVNIEIVHREFRGPVVDFFWDTFRHSQLSYQARNALENFNNPSSSHKELLNLEKISTWIDRRARSDTPSTSESPVIHPAVLPAAPLPTRPYTSTTISQILSAAVPALQITPITDVTVPLDATHGSNETPVTQPPSDPDTSNVTGPSNFLVSTPITTSNTKPVATTSCGVSPRMPSDANGDMVAKSLSRFSPATPTQSPHIPPETSAMTNGSSCQPDCSSPPRDPCTITAPALPPVLQSDPSNRVIDKSQSLKPVNGKFLGIHSHTDAPELPTAQKLSLDDVTSDIPFKLQPSGSQPRPFHVAGDERPTKRPRLSISEVKMESNTSSPTANLGSATHKFTPSHAFSDVTSISLRRNLVESQIHILREMFWKWYLDVSYAQEQWTDTERKVKLEDAYRVLLLQERKFVQDLVETTLSTVTNDVRTAPQISREPVAEQEKLHSVFLSADALAGKFTADGKLEDTRTGNVHDDRRTSMTCGPDAKREAGNPHANAVQDTDRLIVSLRQRIEQSEHRFKAAELVTDDLHQQLVSALRLLRQSADLDASSRRQTEHIAEVAEKHEPASRRRLDKIVEDANRFHEARSMAQTETKELQVLTTKLWESEEKLDRVRADADAQVKVATDARRRAEGEIDILRRECREPFIVPSLVDTFLMLSRLAEHT